MNTTQAELLRRCNRTVSISAEMVEGSHTEIRFLFFDGLPEKDVKTFNELVSKGYIVPDFNNDQRGHKLHTYWQTDLGRLTLKRYDNPNG